MNLDQLSPKIKALILDMDGVLWRADEAIGDLVRNFEAITARGLKVSLATNNSTRNSADYVQKLASFGVNLDESQVFNCSEVLAVILKEKFPKGGEVYIVGGSGLAEVLTRHGFTPYTAEENDLPPALEKNSPVAVVSGLDIGINYKKLAQATLLIRAGVPYYATNPDNTYPSTFGQLPGAGSIIAALTAATGVDPIVAGKPEPYLFNLAMQQMGVSPEETLVVGDRLETDILGGRNAGCKTALVLTGVATREEGQAWIPKVDMIVENLSNIVF
ncbi:MAG: HAD-IIA family hydrolase [Anaerolineae bacterium]|nr:HAD-IIA family hydrolase [Anaerolineae bacterium]